MKEVGILVIESRSKEETIKIGEKMGRNAKPGDVFCLSGELGAGKTVFAKGFAKGLGIDKEITSPTFTIINEYIKGDINFYHFDLYRINSIDEMDDICCYEYFDDGICLIEWPDIAKEIIPERAVWIYILKPSEIDALNIRVINIKENSM